MPQIQQLLATWRGLPRRVKIIIAAVAAITLIVGLLLVRGATATQWVAVSEGMRTEQIGEAQDVLSAESIDARANASGTGIEVPAGDQFRAAGLLMTNGIAAKGAHVSCERMFGEGSSMLAETSAQHAQKIKDCTQNELSNAIEKIAGVSSAQVMLNLPEDQLYLADKAKAEASVLITSDGERLPSKTVGAIQKSVAGAVKDLDAEQVVVTDDSGNTLSDSVEGGAAVSEREAKLRAEAAYNGLVEQKLTAQYEDVAGKGRVKVIENVELDMDAIRREVKEVGGKNNDQGPAESQITERELVDGATSAADGGAAGTASNVGIDPDTRSVLNTGTAASGSDNYLRSADRVTYTNDEVREVIDVASGHILRHRLSVLVDSSVNADTAAAIRNAAQAWMGGNAQDSFSFDQARFASDETTASTGAQTVAVMAYLKWILLGVSLLGMAFVLRRVLNNRTQELMTAHEEMLLLGTPDFKPIPIADLEAALNASSVGEGRKRQELQRKVEQIAAQNPADVANELRRWMAAEDPAHTGYTPSRGR